MNERLIAFLQAEELSSARFADLMKIQRSGVSHLLSGRNKPGYDFFEKFLQKFPTINIEWLISGRGKMYKEQANPVIEPKAVIKPPPKPIEGDLFSQQVEKAPPLPSIIEQPASVIARDEASSPPSTPPLADPLPRPNRQIQRLIILYSDGSYEERG
ncbi:MAG: helix-turn-helix domain-containing protein [Bacteroidales bacterium]|nr:helix-turn-helix domain-containing protein [Bacteroidales bacterium]